MRDFARIAAISLLVFGVTAYTLWMAVDILFKVIATFPVPLR